MKYRNTTYILLFLIINKICSAQICGDSIILQNILFNSSYVIGATDHIRMGYDVDKKRQFGNVLFNPGGIYILNTSKYFSIEPGTIITAGNSSYFITNISNVQRGCDFITEKDNSAQLLAFSLTSDLSPNPFHQKTIFKIQNASKNINCTLLIFDMYGRKVKQINNITTSTIEINRENLASGIYQYQLLGDKIISSGKMVIE